MIDDNGRLVGNVEGRIVDQMIMIRSEYPNKIRSRNRELRQKLSFSPIQ